MKSEKLGKLALDEYQRRQMRPENQHHFLPVTSRGDMTIVPWETWVYTNIGEGIEITFTNELGNGVYSYAPLPRLPPRRNHHWPASILPSSRITPPRGHRQAAQSAKSPTFTRPAAPMSGLGFHYDFADFRGADGRHPPRKSTTALTP